ncbi:MAG: glycosyltransferase family 39 protein [Planctomycetes bacterium]|nr:glycosyltransferase family 39 protein [Planctomycetota bacterium]
MPSVRAWILIGVSLRAVLAILAGQAELQSDEAHYAWLGLSWERFGFLSDSQRFLWPPAYPYLHKLGFQLFQDEGILALRSLQVLASGLTGWGVAGLTRRLVQPEAARWAACLWALHLPLAGYCTLGWPDSLFIALLLPALCFLHDGAIDDNPGRLLLAGLLLGLSALFKEIGLHVGILATCWVFIHTMRRSAGVGPTTLTFALALALPLAPWAARNLQHYGQPIPSGVTLGENLYQGWNSTDRNFDNLPLLRRHPQEERPALAPAAPFALTGEGGWDRPGGLTLLERDAAKRKGALEWAQANLGDLARSRVAKLAHMIAPTSFPVRHIALENYPGMLADRLISRPFIALATLQAALAALLGAAAIASCAPRHGLFWLPTAAFLAQPLLVGMSRLRVPLTPFLIIAVASLLTTSLDRRQRRRAVIAGAITLGLFWVDLASTTWVLGEAWGAE